MLRGSYLSSDDDDDDDEAESEVKADDVCICFSSPYATTSTMDGGRLVNRHC